MLNYSQNVRYLDIEHSYYIGKIMIITTCMMISYLEPIICDKKRKYNFTNFHIFYSYVFREFKILSTFLLYQMLLLKSMSTLLSQILFQPIAFLCSPLSQDI